MYVPLVLTLSVGLVLQFVSECFLRSCVHFIMRKIFVFTFSLGFVFFHRVFLEIPLSITESLDLNFRIYSHLSLCRLYNGTLFPFVSISIQIQDRRSYISCFTGYTDSHFPFQYNIYCQSITKNRVLLYIYLQGIQTAPAYC